MAILLLKLEQICILEIPYLTIFYRDFSHGSQLVVELPFSVPFGFEKGEGYTLTLLYVFN